MELRRQTPIIPTVIDSRVLSDGAVREFATLQQQKSLKKIGHADLLIASVALANYATLVTRNLRQFRHIPKLNVDNWLD